MNNTTPISVMRDIVASGNFGEIAAAIIVRRCHKKAEDSQNAFCESSALV
jgi:hypothetical protein